MTIRIRSLSEPRVVVRNADPPGDASVCLRNALAGLAGIGVLALLSLPAARAVSETFGWMPLWLLATPTVAWLALWLSRDRQAAVRRVATGGGWHVRPAAGLAAPWHARAMSDGPVAGRRHAA